jgi:TRAP-type C4-dicarboxylate transport system substrate-binding protein
VGTFASDSIAGLKSGAVELIALPPFSFAAYKVDDASKYMTDNVSLGVTFCYFGVGVKAWDALPPKVQQVMLSLRAPAVARSDEIFTAEAAGHIAAFKQKGLEVSSFAATDRARLVAKAIKIWQAWVEEREKQGLGGREVFEFTQAKIRESAGK